MQFKLVVLTSLLSLASADLPQFIADVQSYERSLAADPSVRSLFASLTSLSPSQISQLRGIGTALATVSFTGDYWSAAPAEYSAFPSPWNSYLLSAWSVESSLARKDGVITAGPTLPAETTPATPSGEVSATGASGSSTAASSGSGSASGSASESASESTSGSGSGSGSGSASGSGSSSGAASGSAGSAGASSVSSAGAASPTGMIVMGAVAGIIGGAAALL